MSKMMKSSSVLQKKELQLFKQIELNDLVRDLGLTKEKAELLGSRLKEKNLLADGTSICVYRKREHQFSTYFDQEGDLVHCSNIPGLIDEFGVLTKKTGDYLSIHPKLV
uniref:Uncharacterized protein n=1 Tax=Clastoptera arizonana TaxID=38151 RepID=A0A1B6CY49_9HEMI